MLTCSVIIVTKNRVGDLQDTLVYIFASNRLPDETIIVDDSTNNDTYTLCKHYDVHYVRGNGKGITTARNIGLQYAKGDVILFIDDDIQIDSNYIINMMEYYTNNKLCLGQMGYDTNFWMINKLTRFRNLCLWVVGEAHRKQNTCTLLPSFLIVWPYPEPSNNIITRWLNGCNMSYRREVFDETKFNDQLTGYSMCEDLEFSYQLYKRHPGSMVLNMQCKLFHRYSDTNRIKGVKSMKMSYLNRHTMFLKHMEKTPYNVMFFYYSVFASFLLFSLYFLWSRITRCIYGKYNIS